MHLLIVEFFNVTSVSSFLHKEQAKQTEKSQKTERNEDWGEEKR